MFALRLFWLFVCVSASLLNSALGQDDVSPAIDTAKESRFQLPTPEDEPSTSDSDLVERLRTLEKLNGELADRVESGAEGGSDEIERILERYDTLLKSWSDKLPDTASSDTGRTPPSDVASNSQRRIDDSPVPDYTEGNLAPFSLELSDTASKSSDRLPLDATFGPGFRWSSEDDTFRLQVDYESQIEARIWDQGEDAFPNSGISGIYLPRQRIFFHGHITKPIEYEFSINRGVNNLNLLNAYINLHFDDQFEVRLGRFFTPFPYDQFAISNYWLPTPERSLFTTNVGLNRQFGAMAWGYLFNEQCDYAAGVFNGSRNSFENTDNAVDFVGYLNHRPFQEYPPAPVLEFLNLGTSIAFGHQDQSPVPLAFRIGGGSPDTSIPGSATVPFLILNPDVVERGERLLGSVHVAHFVRSLSLIGEWQYGFGSYATAANSASVRVPFSGFYIAAGYFLTGEQVKRRSRVYPLRPFLPLKKGDARGPGAWEAVARVSQLQLGDEVFAAGFADQNQWSNRALTTELGANWYLNEYTKVYAFWLHGDFNEPVAQQDGGFNKSADLFWLRCQLYF